MFNFDYITKEYIKERNPNWPEISDHSYRILIIGGSRSGKTNALLNLINNEPNIDKIYWYANDPNQAKYQLLINKRESAGLKYLNDAKVFIEYSNDMDDIYKNVEEYNRYLMTWLLSNKKLNTIVPEYFIRKGKLNISLIFSTHLLDEIQHTILLWKFQSKDQQIAFNHSSDIDFQDFMYLFKKFTTKPYSFLVIGTTLASDNSSSFRKNLSEKI